MKHIRIAIDGPSGAGKSTIAKYAAKKLGFHYVDTGALYRAIGYFFTSRSIEITEEAVKRYLDELQVDVYYDADGQHVRLNGADVTGKIRTGAAGMAASKVAAFPEVRKKLLGLQQAVAEKYSVVMDGRDIGTTVLPDAEIKIFLTASAEDRARRRFLELRQKGEDTTLEQVLSDVEKRDYDDAHRAVSPLRQAEDAHRIDTTGNTLEQSQEQIADYIAGRLSDVL